MSETELSGGIVAPLAGTMVAITDVPDPVFASKAMGNGFAVAPSADDVVAPCAGTVNMVAKTAHAFGIRTDEGLEILVHMGIDTVELEGAPFSMNVEVDERVEAGQPLSRMDLAAVEAAGKSTMTMVIFLNLAQKKGTVEAATGPIGLGERAATLDIPEADAPAPAATPVAAPAAEVAATGKTDVASGHPSGNTIFNADFFGIPVALPQGNAYAYSIFPIIVAAYLASLLEPELKKYIPSVVRMIFAPLLEVFIISTVMLVVFGPIIMFISGGIANGINGVLELNYAIVGLVIGAFYQCLVIFGLHWAVIPLVASQIAIDGLSPLNAIISATMVAQGGGALAIWIKTRSQKIKTLAGPATISAFAGITEPAMYGLNLKYGRVFITASAGGAVGGFLTGLMDVNMYGFTGAFVGFPSFVNPEGLDHSFWGFLIASAAALVVSLTLTYFFGYSDNDLETERAVKKVRLGKREPAGV